MQTFRTLVDIFDIFSRKKTMGMWIWILIYAGGTMALNFYNILAISVPEGSVAGSIMFFFFLLFFASGLIFQLNNKPPKLYMVIHTRTGTAVLKTPVTASVARLHALGVRGDSFSYIPYKNYLKMKKGY